MIRTKYSQLQAPSKLMLSVLFLSLLVAQPAGATKKLFPHGCRTEGFRFSNHLLHLTSTNEEGQTLYLFHNISYEPVLLRHEKLKSEIYKADFANVIYSDQWAAFATDKPEVTLRCSIMFHEQEGHPITCSDALELCQYNRAKFGPSNGGNYWVVQSEPGQKTVIRKTIKSGVLLRW